MHSTCRGHTQGQSKVQWCLRSHSLCSQSPLKELEVTALVQTHRHIMDEPSIGTKKIKNN